MLVAPVVQARKPKSIVDQAIAAYQATNSTTLPAAGTIEVAFSPNEGSEHLVVNVIDSAKTELDLLSYSFTSVPVVEALVRARHRGVVVRLVADEKDNVSADHSGKARAALGALVNAGADVRTIRVYPIHHDKVIIADRQTVELGQLQLKRRRGAQEQRERAGQLGQRQARRGLPQPLRPQLCAGHGLRAGLLTTAAIRARRPGLRRSLRVR